MKKFLTLLCLAGSCIAAYAQNLVIYQKGGSEPTIIPVANIEYMEVKSHPEMTELVEVKILNLGRFSFDVEVTKGDNCALYVVGAKKTSVYKEADFVEDAQRTLDEEAYSRPYIKGIGTADQVFTESQLGINAIENYDNDNRVQITTTVAVYAIDTEGNGKVYSVEFQVPKATTVSTPTANIEVSNVTFDNFSVAIAASDDCKKIIYGITSRSALNGTAMSADAMISDKISQGLPISYDGEIKIDAKAIMQLESNSTYYPYVIPIAADGKLGPVKFLTVTTTAITADGTGRILSANGTLQSEGQHKHIIFPAMTFNDNTKKVRVMWWSENDFENYKNNLVEVFGKESNNKLAWDEYDIDALPRTLPVWHPGEKYYLYAAAVDQNGHVGEPQDVLALLGVETPYTTNAKTDVVPDLTFDGTAIVNIVNDQTDVDKSAYTGVIYGYMPYFTITPGQNLKRLLVVPVDVTASNVEKAVSSALVGYPNYVLGDDGVKYEFTWTGSAWTLVTNTQLYNYTNEGNTIRFQEKWLSDVRLVFVAIDQNNRPKITHTYIEGANGLKEYK